MRLARQGPLQMSGARVFVDPKADAKEPILKAIREGGGCLVHSRAQAHIIVVKTQHLLASETCGQQF